MLQEQWKVFSKIHVINFDLYLRRTMLKHTMLKHNFVQDIATLNIYVKLHHIGRQMRVLRRRQVFVKIATVILTSEVQR